MTEHDDAAHTLGDRTAEDLRAMVEASELQPLLATLTYLTGDLSFIDPRFSPRSLRRGARAERHAGLPAGFVKEGRELAFQGLWRIKQDGGHRGAPETLEHIVQFATGGASGATVDLLRHELGTEPGEYGNRVSPVVQPRGLTAIIIGAGVSGIAAAVNLQAAGVDVTIFEKNQEVGGAWWENTYPGCRLDTPNFTYSFSFAQRDRWPDHYSRQPVLRDYMIDVSKSLSVRDKIHFGVEVISAEFDESAASWHVLARDIDGRAFLRTANILVSAVGQLNRPSIPDIAGLDTFTGDVMHSAAWNHEVDLRGRKVAVVGTGASAFQIVPEVAGSVARLTVFQRNPPWMLPTPNYRDPIDGPLRELFERLPTYGRWYRFWQFVLSMEAWLPVVEVDPSWRETGSVSAENAEFRRSLLAELAEQFRDDPDLLEALTPTYPPGAKRMLRDNGDWGRALRRPNVTVEADPIARIDGSEIVTRDGHRIEADVIVFATGFKAQDFLSPMRIVGRQGLALEDWWRGDARAYATVTVPHFPNLFLLLGPNSGLAANGSLIFMSECAAEYIVLCLSEMVRRGASAMEPTVEAYESFTRTIDQHNRARAWGIPGVSTWYQNKFGRVSQNWPLGLAEYWELTHRVRAEDYRYDTGGDSDISAGN